MNSVCDLDVKQLGPADKVGAGDEGKVPDEFRF